MGENGWFEDKTTWLFVFAAVEVFAIGVTCLPFHECLQEWPHILLYVYFFVGTVLVISLLIE